MNVGIQNLASRPLRLISPWTSNLPDHYRLSDYNIGAQNYSLIYCRLIDAPRVGCVHCRHSHDMARDLARPVADDVFD